MKKSINKPNHWNNIVRQSSLEKFQRKITFIDINEDLIEYIGKTINSLESIDEKMLYLFTSKKVLLQVERNPDEAHYFAFEAEYIRDGQKYNPIKWLEAELEFWKNVKTLKSEQKTSSEIAQAKLSLSKQWLTMEEVQEMFHFSRTTLNRRVAEGMPCHQKGKLKFFNLQEISEWLKEEETA